MTVQRPRHSAGLLLSADQVVFDTTFPRHLAELGTPYVKVLLRTMFAGRAVIPGAVNRELGMAATLHSPAVAPLIGRFPFAAVVDLDLDEYRLAEAIREELPKTKFTEGENRGEAQAIVLAQQLGCPLIIDEGAGTRAAIGRGVPTFGCVTVLLLAAHQGSYSDDEAWDIFSRLLTGGGLLLPKDSPWTADEAGEVRFRETLDRWRGQ